MAVGKSYRVQYPNGKEANVSEAVAEIYKDREGHKILFEVDRKTGERVVKSRGGSAPASSEASA